jgi:renalase
MRNSAAMSSKTAGLLHFAQTSAPVQQFFDRESAERSNAPRVETFVVWRWIVASLWFTTKTMNTTQPDSRSKILIVGAGLTGLLTARELASLGDVKVFDKARGVGGRMATRRTDQARFDHGAQFYSLKDPVRELHERWLSKNLVKKWFAESGVDRFVANDGMTALAKDLAAELHVVLNERVSTLKRLDDAWQATFESGRVELAHHVIMTCPVPQSIEILERSGVPHDPKLRNVTYTKALVALIESSATPFEFVGGAGYVEPKNDTLFSVADQFEKGISRTPALTVTLAPKLSAELYDAADAAILSRLEVELRRISPNFKMADAQVKKWRFCQVEHSFGEHFTEVEEGLTLAGDGFGGASLNGAARSAKAVALHLKEKLGPPNA